MNYSNFLNNLLSSFSKGAIFSRTVAYFNIALTHSASGPAAYEAL